MGKIIQVTRAMITSKKFGHIIGFRDNKILCEELDSNYDFIIENGRKKVFSCSPDAAIQIGYLTPEEIMLKR